MILANGGSSLGDLLEVPVVKTASVAAGTGYVGAWNQLVVWTRSTDVFISRTHSDYLTLNLAAVLAEIRLAVGVLAPVSLLPSYRNMMAGLEAVFNGCAAWVSPTVQCWLSTRPPTELVSPVDIIRVDGLGRSYVAVPAWQTPHSHVVLTAEERRSLVQPPPSLPDGTLEPGAGGFTPRNTRLGFTLESGGRGDADNETRSATRRPNPTPWARRPRRGRGALKRHTYHHFG